MFSLAFKNIITKIYTENLIFYCLFMVRNNIKCINFMKMLIFKNDNKNIRRICGHLYECNIFYRFLGNFIIKSYLIRFNNMDGLIKILVKN